MDKMSIWKLACFYLLVLFVSGFVTSTDARPSLTHPVDQSSDETHGLSSERQLVKRLVRSLPSSATGLDRDQRFFWKVKWLIRAGKGIANAVKKG